MKIKSLHLKNFKRFTDLTIGQIPEQAKLVLLIGSNGSGKSSVFDALEVLNKARFNNRPANTSPYYSKNGQPFEIIADFGDGYITNSNKIIHTGAEIKIPMTGYYGRTSFRQVPRLTKTQLGTGENVLNDADKPDSFIDRDIRFENDLEHLFGKLLKEFFRSDSDKSEIKETVIYPINQAFDRIFNKENGTRLELVELIPPLEGRTAAVNFKKGDSFFHYNQLSAGEKEIFNILINLIARRDLHPDVIYFDEIDLHLNTHLQYNFLKELTEHWIPEHAQFWTASHSLGFIDYANDVENACVFDLDDLDFDKPQLLIPQEKNKLETFEIAVSKKFIDKIIQGRKIVFAENKNTSFYNDLGIENTLFFIANDKIDAFHKAKNYNQAALIDRDYLSEQEVLELRKTYPFLYLLPYYSFENLLYHPENLAEYYSDTGEHFDLNRYVTELTAIKNRELPFIAAGIVQARNSYPFFKENEHSKLLKKFKDNYKEVIELLRSDIFDEFYAVFPAKDYGGPIKARNNIPVTKLAKTNWFKTQIVSLLKT